MNRFPRNSSHGARSTATASAAVTVLAAAVALLQVCAAQPATYFSGSGTQVATGGPAVVVVVESLGDLQKEWVDGLADKYGAAVGIEATALGDMTGESMVDELQSALAATSVLPSAPAQLDQYPVIAFGKAATLATNLSHAGWPTVVAVCANLSEVSLPPIDMTIQEADAAPLLLLVSDIEENGPLVTETEEMLDAAGLHWETIRYGGTGPEFYLPTSAGYDPSTWGRAYEAITTFIDDALTGGTPGTQDPGTEVPPGVTVETPFMYEDNGTMLEGYLAYPTEAVAQGMLLPGVVILPDADGLEGYEFSRAHMLAEMGYVALGANSYGLPVGESPANSTQRGELLNFWRGNPEMYVRRIRAAVGAVRALSYVNSSAIGMTGYCFGGSGVVFDVLANSDIQVDVSFHGGISVQPNITTTPPAKPYLTFQSGGADESPEDIAWLQESLTTMGGEWDITRYSKVLHAFTAWSRPDRYHPRADGRSWAAMAARFEEFIPSPAGNMSHSNGTAPPPSDSAAGRASGGALAAALLALLALAAA
eukprot:jgi/Tetstr1/432335/TSEL_021733.t1